MNVLIVDDDRFVVASLTKGLNWNKLGFTNIYTAYNIIDAKTIITENSVNLLLSDIDMPLGSGLELLSWIRDNHNDMPVIFLTNYADFNYAQKALALKSFHYFLKPIEYDKLTKIIQDATLFLTQHNIQSQKNCENFWHSYLQEEIPNTANSLQMYIHDMQLPYHTTDIFVPILFVIFPYYLTADNRLCSRFTNQTSQNNYLSTTFEAIFVDILTPSDVFLEYNTASNYYLAILRVDSTEISPFLSMNCERFIKTVSSQMQCNLNCFIGVPSQLASFLTNFKALRSMMTNCLDYECQTLFLSNYQPPTGSFPACNTAILELYLENNQFHTFLDYCHEYLQSLSVTNKLHAVSMNNFQIDVAQTLYVFLRNKGILANKLFHGDDYHALSYHAKNSISDMELYLRYIIRLTQEHLEATASSPSIAKSIQDYVDQHYSEDISRSSLTDIFYLDSDYASKLFKKETGISFKNYIIHRRIEAAKELLSTTNLPINTISDNVGYANYSYFTRLFKKVTNMTPIEYRNKMQHLSASPREF